MFLLSFDIEEFDMPLEYGKSIAFEHQIEISRAGTIIILDLLKKHGLKATFFSTAVFAIEIPDLIQRIIAEGHELASHTYYHSEFKNEDLISSKKILEEISGVTVIGLRMPRMAPVSHDAVIAAGYRYNSSINPTFLPGRYNNLHISRTYFKEKNLLQIPASVSPILRIPLFWLSFHNFPLWVYKFLIKRTFNKDGYVNCYFHPWEFIDLTDRDTFGLPKYVSRNSGNKMVKRMDVFMNWINIQKYKSDTYKSLINI